MREKKRLGGSGRRPMMIWGVVLALTLTACAAEQHSEAKQETPQTESGQPKKTQSERKEPEREKFVVAHRAGAKLAPENTLAALERSIAAGADMAEIDVRLTRDGTLVAMHDTSLARTTGLCCEVCETDYQTVRDLDAGGWYGESFQGERVPTLAEVLEAAEGRIRLMIETKCETRGRETVEAAVRLIQDKGWERDCVLACENVELLQAARALCPGLETVYIGDSLTWELVTQDGVDGYNIQFTGLDRESVSQAQGRGRKVYAWTVNTEEEMDQALALGVDGLVSDDPELALERVEAQREARPAEEEP